MATQRSRRVNSRKRTSRTQKAGGKKKTYTKKPREVYPIPKGLPYDAVSYTLFFAGLILALIGFYLLWKGDDVASVITMVVGYVILIPIALYRRGRDKKSGEESASQ